MLYFMTQREKIGLVLNADISTLSQERLLAFCGAAQALLSWGHLSVAQTTKLSLMHLEAASRLVTK